MDFSYLTDTNFMCNAFQHPNGCTCGWGGDGHLGKRINRKLYQRVPLVFDRNLLESYTIPNARCPVCGASVFFYQSENGGRVFFNDLGPPWPKHPCTSNPMNGAPLPPASNDTSIKLPGWQKNGWYPVIVKKLLKNKPFNFQVDRIDTLYTTRLAIIINDHNETALTKNDLIIFAKRKDKESFQLTVFEINDQLSFEVDVKDSRKRLNSFFNNEVRKLDMST
jgi:hypothetical protein